MNILVTAIGSFSADCVIRTLRKANHAVIGCDIYPGQWHAETALCNKFYQSPLAKDEEKYISFIADVCKKEKIDLLLPLTDIEIDKINSNRQLFDELGVILAIPSEFTLSIARDKYKLHTFFLADENVPSVESYLSKNLIVSPDILPAIAKPIDGRSSEGLKRIWNLDELETVANENNYIVQKCIEGSVFTVDYVRNATTGNSFSVAREELLRTKNGAGTTIRLFEDSVLSNLVDFIGGRLNINGCVNMEFILNSGKFYLIDINPRFSAGVAFSSIGGYDMVTSHINCHIGQDINNHVKIEEQIVIKKYVEEIVNC